TAQWISNELYAVGGVTAGGSVLASLDDYNPANNTWRSKSPISVPREHLGMQISTMFLNCCHSASGAVVGILYVVGGRSPTNVDTTEEYNPLTDTWTLK